MNPLYLPEDESFSLTAYVESPGYQRIALTGYLVSRRADGTYIAPIIPQLFYGADGAQLQTWRQNLTTTGSQVILSRAAGGYPKVPKQELYWRKVSDFEEEKVVAPLEEVKRLQLQIPNWVLPSIFAGLVLGGVVLAFYLGRRK